jgi:hypothetical protein
LSDQMSKYAKGSNWWIRQHARIDGQCKKRDGKSKIEPKSARDKKYYNSNEECLSWAY